MLVEIVLYEYAAVAATPSSCSRVGGVIIYFATIAPIRSMFTGSLTISAPTIVTWFEPFNERLNRATTAFSCAREFAPWRGTSIKIALVYLIID